MCDGIEFQGKKIYFQQPEARLPVRLRDGNVTWATWGEAIGKIPNGSWTRLSSIINGKWQPWHPRPVLIAANLFVEKDREGKSHWIELDKKMVIQGLLAEREEQWRVYVVTTNRHQNMPGYMIAGRDWLNWPANR